MWRNLKCILLSERSQSEKGTYCVIPTTLYSGKGKTKITVKRSVVARGSWGGREGCIGGAQRVFRPVNLFCMIL